MADTYFHRGPVNTWKLFFYFTKSIWQFWHEDIQTPIITQWKAYLIEKNKLCGKKIWWKSKGKFQTCGLTKALGWITWKYQFCVLYIHMEGLRCCFQPNPFQKGSCPNFITPISLTSQPLLSSCRMFDTKNKTVIPIQYVQPFKTRLL